jgi:hypothetical protein
MRHRVRWVPFLLFLGATACGGDASGPPAPPTVAALRVVSGDRQVATPGAALSGITVMAADTAGRAVPGVIVEFAVAAGGGSVAVARDTSDVSGRTVTSWTVGTVAGEAQTLTASVVGTATGGAAAPVRIEATVIPGSPAALVANTNAASARMGMPFNAPLSITVRDAHGNRVRTAGRLVTSRIDNAPLVVLGGDHAVSTDSSGTATFSGLLVSGRAGSASLILESGGLAASPITLSLTGGIAKRLEPVDASVQAIPRTASGQLKARALDAWGNPSAGTTITFALDGIGVIGRATTDADGIATLTQWTVPEPGIYDVAVSAEGATASHFSLVSRPGAPAVFAFTQNAATSGAAGQPFLLSIIATDVGGNPSPNATFEWNRDGADSGEATTDANGRALISVRLGPKVGDNRITFRVGSATSSLVVRGVPGAARKVVPATATVSAPVRSVVRLTFTVLDEFDNVVPGLPMTGRLYDESGVPKTTTSVTDGLGVATFAPTMDELAGMATFYAFPTVSFFSNVYAEVVLWMTSSVGTLRMPMYDCTGAFALSFSVRVFGPTGMLTGGIPVTFSPAPGHGTVRAGGIGPVSASVTVLTDAAGVAGVRWDLPAPSGTYSITTSAPGMANSPIVRSCTR